MNSLEDLRRYRFTHHLVIQVLLALEDIRFIEYVHNRDQFTLKEATDDLNVLPKLLETLLEYLCVHTHYFRKVGTGIFRKGEEFNELPFFLYFAAGYKLLFEQMGDITKGKLQASDIGRDNRKLQEANAYLRSMAPFLAKELRRQDVKELVELGCGLSWLLKYFLDHKVITKGIGIEKSISIVEEVKGAVKTLNLDDTLSIICADLIRIQDYQSHCKKADAFIAINILHEFFKDGEASVVSLLAEFRETFQGKLFFLIEFDSIPWEKMKEQSAELKRLASLHALVHPFSFQGEMQSKEKWLQILEQASVAEIKEVQTLANNMILYTLRL